MQNFYVTKADGTSEIFREEKLIDSLVRAGAKREIAEQITTDVIETAVSGVSTSEIYKTAFRELRREHRPTAARYSLRRALFDLGPTGFPFEDFVAALFKKMGYKVRLRQVVPGKCINHELDVVATKDGECVAIEVKFHNSPGFKTNVRTALYVQARMEDIFAKRDEDPKSCPVNRPLLLTNTKFTKNAVEYASCVGLDMLGWRYPEKDSLLDLITEYDVYPITALTTLSRSQKQSLITKGIILCEELERNKEALIDLGLSRDHVSEILQEAKGLSTMPI
ncbi:MAG: ATP cone domain-containing protein [Patescibacteria group bacterium UBA2103]